MALTDPLKSVSLRHIQFGERRIAYRVLSSTAAKKLRIRIGPKGVEVLRPDERNGEEVSAFLQRNKLWILDQLKRVDRLRRVRRVEKRRAAEMLFRGEATGVRVEERRTRARGNSVEFIDGEIVVRSGASSRVHVARSLENWLRKQARIEIQRQLTNVLGRLRRSPGRVYVMGQRTKWGNCSAQKNLSFNWRLILAPDFVRKYLVTHEATHLALPDHSVKFWLTVQSLCPETERAKQWLAANGRRLLEPLPLDTQSEEQIGSRTPI